MYKKGIELRNAYLKKVSQQLLRSLTPNAILTIQDMQQISNRGSLKTAFFI